ncbi:MAG: Arm DNA-binding domain-containing protein [Bacteroidales bacterium]
MTARPHISFLFYIKRTKLLKNGEAPIYLKIKVDKGKAELALFRSIQPQQWDAAKNKARGNTKEADDINKYMNYIRQQISNHLNHLYDTGFEISALRLKNSFLGISENGKTIIGVVQEHNRTVKLLVGKEYAPATYRKFVTTLQHLKDYIKSNY